MSVSQDDGPLYPELAPDQRELALLLAEYAGYEPGDRWAPDYLDVGLVSFTPWLLERLQQAGWRKP